MSYLVFARKWRPLTFDDVVGQEHITETLKKAIEKNRVAHAYIFTGTRGVGKTTSARILARALNCENGPTPNPCGVCNYCKDIISGASFDVLEIDGASNNSVDDIRELRENIGYSSMGGKYRIFVIDEVHMLSKSAFNALLKTLEEPPKNVIFIFATTEPQKIPATIHSRCQRYDFRRIGAEPILDRLVHICTEEKITFERSALMLVARKAEGSMRDALSLLDQVYSFCRENLMEKEVRTVLGLVGMEVYDRIMDAMIEKSAAPALKIVQDVLFQGFDLQEFILGLQEHIRNLLFARIPSALESKGIDLEPEVVQRFVSSSTRFSEGDLLRMAEIVRKAEQDLKWSAFPRFVVELMLLKLIYLDSTVSMDQLLKLIGDSGSTIPDQIIQNSNSLNANSESKKKSDN
jgi:DNA polymerase-3 subunit gamma/tau